MPTTRVTFASTNRNKFLEVQAILAPFGITVDFGNISLVELQSDSLEQIAREKAKSAFEQLGGPVFVEDDGLFIKVLKNFPGQYSSFVFKTIGNEGILRLIEGVADRSAYFSSLIAYHDGTGVSVSEGKVEGRISDTPSEGGWGYDPIFVPSGSSLTFAELKEEKNRFSHRRRALEKFADQLLAGS